MNRYFIRTILFCGLLLSFCVTATAQVPSTAATASQQPVQPASESAAQPSALVDSTKVAESKAVTLADAQKAYVAGNWKEAAGAYEQVCPTLTDSARTECLLWNILALSQTSSAKDFSKAGKRLDSLIQKTSPQHPVYADLMMTKAQFQLYLGRHQKAAEALVHAIETSQPHQAVVLQKVCDAVLSKVKNQALDDACQRLKAQETPAANQVAADKAAKTAPAPAVQPAEKTDQPQSSASTSVQSAQTTEANQAAASTEPAKQPQAISSSKEVWYLQLGAFSKKDNAVALVNLLKKSNIASTIEERKGEIKTLYLVQSGNFESKEKAVDFGAKKLAPLKVEFRALPRN